MKSQGNCSQLQREFGVYEDDNGVFRCTGRIANADLPLETKFPALLARDHHISTLLVRQAHERVHHNKVEATLAQLRTRYWIMRGRQFVKKILASCTVCRRYEGRGYRVPPQGDLPEFRLSQKPAFTYVGVDLMQDRCTLRNRIIRSCRKCMSSCLRAAQPEPFIWNLLQICQLTRLSVVYEDSQLEGAHQKSLLLTMRKHSSLQQRFCARCFRIPVLRDSLLVEGLRGDLMWTEHPGGVAFSKE